MRTSTLVVAAAPTWVGRQLAGPALPVPVVHAGPDAVYVGARDRRRCIGVLSRAATGVPCGLRTTLADLSGVAGSYAVIGEHRLHIGDVEIAVGRLLDVSAPPLDLCRVPVMRTALQRAAARSVVRQKCDAARGELPAAAIRLLALGDPAAVPLLLGRGSGLTPTGDDVLAGWLATMYACGQAAPAVVDAVHRQAGAATTLLSATLLDCAAVGDVVPEFARLLSALDAVPSPPAPGQPQPILTGAVWPVQGGETGHTAPLDATGVVDGLVGIGHTSGAGLLLGADLALDHLGQRSHRR